MNTRLDALANSVQRLRAVAASLGDDDFTAPAYPSEWTIADTFSHLGSGAVISAKRLSDTLGRTEPDDHFNAAVWDEWNAKSPVDQVRDALVADGDFLEDLLATDDDERAAFTFAMGPMQFDFEGFVGLRLGEHALHTWDIEVTFNEGAILDNEAANHILNALKPLIARLGRPTGDSTTVVVRTLEPVRTHRIVLTPDAVAMYEGTDEQPDIEMPAESFARLLYGRLDPAHTSPELETPLLETLRTVFPGF